MTRAMQPAEKLAAIFVGALVIAALVFFVARPGTPAADTASTEPAYAAADWTPPPVAQSPVPSALDVTGLTATWVTLENGWYPELSLTVKNSGDSGTEDLLFKVLFSNGNGTILSEDLETIGTIPPGRTRALKISGARGFTSDEAFMEMDSDAKKWHYDLYMKAYAKGDQFQLIQSGVVEPPAPYDRMKGRETYGQKQTAGPKWFTENYGFGKISLGDPEQSVKSTYMLICQNTAEGEEWCLYSDSEGKPCPGQSPIGCSGFGVSFKDRKVNSLFMEFKGQSNTYVRVKEYLESRGKPASAKEDIYGMHSVILTWPHGSGAIILTKRSGEGLTGDPIDSFSILLSKSREPNV